MYRLFGSRIAYRVLLLSAVGMLTTAMSFIAAPAAHASTSVGCTFYSPSVSWTSPRPRLVNWSAVTFCNTVVAYQAVLQSTLFFDSGGQSFAIAEGTHPAGSPSYQITTTGSGSPAYGGSFHVRHQSTVTLAPGQGSFDGFNGNCFISNFNQSLTCTENSSEFNLVGDPLVNQGGVVNGVNYDANDIHPGTTVAIFGANFIPADSVIVVQDGNPISIGAGSAWWYDSSGQINATLPTSLHAGGASVYVQTSVGQNTNVVAITIQP
jgi:hypothetical protein